MLEQLRAIQNTWAGKAVVGTVMGLIMVSFVIWGIGPVFTGFNANTLASVGSDTVTVDAYRQAYQNELQQLQSRLRRPITNAQARAFGLDTQVLSRLVSDAVLDDEAHRLGLAISQDQIARAIVGDPAFAGPGGQFDRNRFAELLQQNDMNEQTFVREQRNVYLRQELIQSLVGGLKAPEAALDALNTYTDETRSIDWVSLPPDAAGPVATPDEATLQAYFDQHAAAFRAPEYRKLVVLGLLPAALAKPDAVSAADVAALYDRVKDARFATPETRDVQQIVFPTEAEAQAASAAIKAGKSFADVAAERKLGDKDIALGRVTRAGAYDKAVAEAAFALPADGVSEPVRTPFGFAILRVAAIDPAVVTPLADVEGTLRAEIAAGRTGEAIRAAHDKVEDARASGRSLAEAARAAGLEARTIEAVDATEHDKSGATVDLPDAPALLKAAFASDIGVDNDVVRTGDGGQVFFEVTGIEPARPQTFAEVKARVEAAWRRDEVSRLLAAKAGELVHLLDAGRSVEEVAAANGSLPVQHAGDVKRAGGTGVPAPIAAAVFRAAVDGAGSAPGEGDAQVVFKVLGATVPPLDREGAQATQFATQYGDALADSLMTNYLSQVQGRIGVRINPTAFAAVTGGS